MRLEWDLLTHTIASITGLHLEIFCRAKMGEIGKPPMVFQIRQTPPKIWQMLTRIRTQVVAVLQSTRAAIVTVLIVDQLCLRCSFRKISPVLGLVAQQTTRRISKTSLVRDFIAARRIRIREVELVELTLLLEWATKAAQIVRARSSC